MENCLRAEIKDIFNDNHCIDCKKIELCWGEDVLAYLTPCFTNRGRIKDGGFLIFLVTAPKKRIPTAKYYNNMIPIFAILVSDIASFNVSKVGG